MGRFPDRLLRHPFTFFAAIGSWIFLKILFTESARPLNLTLLCRWDCDWYESIARRGYVSPVPPLFQDLTHSNVAFFPAYPTIARFIADLTSCSYRTALPLVSILCAGGISWLLSRLMREQDSKSVAIKYLILFAYPATFYLFVSYSEALYIALLFLGVYWLRDIESGKGRPISPSIDLLVLALLGYNLGLTRLTGFLIPGSLFLGSVIAKNKRDMIRTACLLGFSGVGLGSFFLYCAAEFGAWNLYFRQLALGWYKEFSPAKALDLYFHPALEAPFEIGHFMAYPKIMSWWVVVALSMILALLLRRCLRNVLRNGFGSASTGKNRFDAALLVGAGAHFMVTVCGDVGPWDRWGNGMRYSLPTVFLLVYLFKVEWLPASFRASRPLQLVTRALLALILAAFFYLQMGYLIRFTRMEWVS